MPAFKRSGAMWRVLFAGLVASGARADTLVERFAPPAGFTRVEQSNGSFGAWLRQLPLLPPHSPVLLFDGRPKDNQQAHAAVVDLDVGQSDLQQCADAVMRLRAEWLWASGKASSVSFNDTAQGAPMAFAQWAKGQRPKAVGRRLVWSASAAFDDSRASFRRYLDAVFTWAGTSSLAKQLRRKSAVDLAPGDVLIQPGFPGHAVLVLDVARGAAQTRVMLGQSYMPAQQFHLLKAEDGGVWFLSPTDELSTATPEWRFPPGSLRTW